MRGAWPARRHRPGSAHLDGDEHCDAHSKPDTFRYAIRHTYLHTHADTHADLHAYLDLDPDSAADADSIAIDGI